MSISRCPNWIRNLFRRAQAEVISEPILVSHEHVEGAGSMSSGVTRFPDGRYGSSPYGHFSVRTTTYHATVFWVRYDNGVERQIRMAGDSAPVRLGHVLTVFFAKHGRREGLPIGFVNHVSQRHHRLMDGREVLDLLDLPLEETWQEVSRPIVPTSARRDRDRTLRNASISAVGGVSALLIGGLIALISSGNSAGAGVVFGVLLLLAGVVAGLFGIVSWFQAEQQHRPTRRTLHSRDFGDDFDDFYHTYRRQALGSGNRPPAVDG